MAQALHAFEEELKTIYFNACEVAVGPQAGRSPSPARLQLQSANRAADVAADVVDLVPHQMRRVIQVRKPKRSKVKSSPAAKAPKGNAARVLTFLSMVLNTTSFTRITQAEIHIGAGIPSGSVNWALTALKEKGLLLEAERGTYCLP